MLCVCVLLRFALSPLVHGAVMLKVMCELCAISYALCYHICERTNGYIYGMTHAKQFSNSHYEKTTLTTYLPTCTQAHIDCRVAQKDNIPRISLLPKHFSIFWGPKEMFWQQSKISILSIGFPCLPEASVCPGPVDSGIETPLERVMRVFLFWGLKGGRGPGGYPSTDNFKGITHTFEHRQTLGFDRLNPEIQKMIGKQRSKVYFLGLA